MLNYLEKNQQATIQEILNYTDVLTWNKLLDIDGFNIQKENDIGKER